MKKNNNENYRNNMRSGISTKDGLLYLLVGGGIGATLALLFAPKAGSELRTDITDMSRRGLDHTKGMAQNLKEQSSGLLGTVKEKAGGVYELASGKIGGRPQEDQQTETDNSNKPNGKLHDLTDQAAPTSQTAGKASSNNA